MNGYEYWHRMLFARFLAENHLLMHPDGVAVSLEECDELAKSENAPNGFVLAARYASRMLPQVFRTDDVLLEIEFAPEQRLALEKLLASLPRETFLADDSLGWVYQFWQSAEKDRVNKSGDKIDGRTLPAVTQLFTEDYMVQFLLHNTIGAWWCARHGIKGPSGGAGVPAGQAPVEMPYLRWRDDGTPAAGSFDGWPKTLKEFTMLDPCCGSGHFLVNAFNLLVPLRMHDEELSAKEACDAVLRENLFGLEIDPRCTQIAAFALALAAWRYSGKNGDPIGYRELPQIAIACSGQGVAGKKDEWLALAGGDSRLREGMDKLYDLFKSAPHFGSLLNPSLELADIFAAGFQELEPLLFKALEQEKVKSDPDTFAVGVAAKGIVVASKLLSRRYTLVATNVPYLGRGDQSDLLKEYCDQHYSSSKTDLATAFMERCEALASKNGTMALVVPRIWTSFTAYYESFRRELLAHFSWLLLGVLGKRAFEMIGGEIVNVILFVAARQKPHTTHMISVVDASSGHTAQDKARLALEGGIAYLSQDEQTKNPGATIVLEGRTKKLPLLSEYVTVFEGLSRGDSEWFDRCFWELGTVDHRKWSLLVNSSTSDNLFDGRESVFLWEDGNGDLVRHDSARIQGNPAWGKKAVFVSRTHLNCLLTEGTIHAQNGVALVPKKGTWLLPVLAYCMSDTYRSQVEALNQKLIKPTGVMGQVPFDLELWEEEARRQFPNGVPVCSSPNPDQWYFDGGIAERSDALQVAVVRLLGYRWPQEKRSELNAIDKYVDRDGIVCIPSVRGESPAAERVQEVLSVAFGKSWSNSKLQELLASAGCKPGTSLLDWLRTSFFDRHCTLFHQRPFIWHIWDGRKDGFSCLVNYHKLNHKALENLTYSYLGDWIKAQAAEAKAGKVGADLRLGAAQALQEKLKLILAGEPPYDIFVRWKPLSEQAIGWHPDLNDGVRMNIRPFVEAGILRKNPNIKWTKDRGREPQRDNDDYPWFWNGKTFVGDRVNDVHLTNAEKLAARKGAK